jgi:hypothetical protein
MIRFAFLAALAVFLLPATSYAQNLSATWANNCGSKTRCVRVFNGIADTNFCLNPGQSYTVYGLAYGATYCAWCSSQRLPASCQRFQVQFN